MKSLADKEVELMNKKRTIDEGLSKIEIFIWKKIFEDKSFIQMLDFDDESEEIPAIDINHLMTWSNQLE